MKKTLSEPGRLYYLDAVRAFALLLGIVFHASLSFMPVYIGWAVMDVSTHLAVSIFAFISHSFRMELFFLIAGFFSHMTFHAKGARAFLKTRWVRIVVPFTVAWFILRPMVVSGWSMGAQSLQGDVDIIQGIISGFVSLRSLPDNLFTGTHLWFLYYLIIITLFVLLLRLLLSANGSVRNRLSNGLDKVVVWFCHSPFAVFIAAPLIAVCLWFMNQWGMDTPDKSLVPHVPVFLIYAGFFVFGWLLHRQRDLIVVFSRLTWLKISLCVVSMLSALILSEYSMKTGHPQYTFLKAGFCLSYALMMWSLVTITIGLFRRWLAHPSQLVRYLADASYWLYLIHLPIVVWLQVAVAELPLHWSLKWFSVSAITILLSLLLYDLFVRSTLIGKVLSGQRKNRLIFRRQGKGLVGTI